MTGIQEMVIMNIFMNSWEKGMIHYSANGAETICYLGEKNSTIHQSKFQLAGRLTDAFDWAWWSRPVILAAEKPEAEEWESEGLSRL